MNNLLNAALVAILVVAGLVLFTPADEPQSYAHIETPAVTVDVGQEEWHSGQTARDGDEAHLRIADPGENVLFFPDVNPDNKWAVILLTHDDWRSRPEERRLVAWFTRRRGEGDRITWTKGDAKQWHFTPSSKHYASYTPAYGTSLPVVAIQRFDGGNSYKVSGGNVPKDCRSLYRGIIKGLAKFRPVKAIVQHRQKVRQVCPDGQCEPNRSRRPFSFLRPFKRPDDTDGTEPPPVDDPPPVDEPSLYPPGYKEPIPDSVSVAPATEPGSDNSLLSLLAVVGGAMVGLLTKQGS